MSSGGSGHKAEIVIIRRNHGGHEDGHHGGAWKIAYADFVTAMMAFFLVMWLINASNEATRAQVASYFNPIKLTDSSTSKRGLEDPKETLKKKKTEGDQPADSQTLKEGASEALKAAEDQMLQHPMEVLDAIAGESAPVPEGKAAADASKAPRDPFDPQSWKAQSGKPPPPADGKAPGSEKAPTSEGKSPPAEKSPPPETSISKSPEKPAEKDQSKLAEAPEAKPPVDAPKPDSSPIAKQPDQIPADLVKEAEAIRADILSKYGAGERALPANLEVQATREGLMISLTDRHQFSMFSVGSAEPTKKLIDLATAISEALKGRPGQVVIRGHTDARPYRNKKFDNWQLSTARAHMAYYMLLRGGLDDTRVARVEGYADRDPINKANPEADENRRIEILLLGAAQ